MDYNDLEAHDEPLDRGEEAIMERRRIARELHVTSDDTAVQAQLRLLGAPESLAGEEAYDRRARLRALLTEMYMNGEDISHLAMDEDDKESEDDKEDASEFFTEGSHNLYNARVDITEYAYERRKASVEWQAQEAQVPLQKLMELEQDTYTRQKSVDAMGFQTASRWPLSCIRCSPYDNVAITGSWGGEMALWNVSTLEKIHDYVKVFPEMIRVESVAWNPAVEGQAMCSGSDGGIHIFNGAEVSASLDGHKQAVYSVAYHPSGRYAGSASADESWRLWDIATQQQLALQEGHQHGIVSIAFQDDGALVCTGGADANARVWDLRSGKSIFVLGGHTKEIRTADWHPNGHELLTAGNDRTIRLWDIRQRGCLAVLPAHRQAVTDVRFSRAPAQPPLFPGLYFVSCSVDGEAKIWTTDDSRLARVLPRMGDSRLSGIDVSYDGQYIVSADLQRTVRLYRYS